MAQLDEKHVAAARVYSRALLDVAAESNAADAILEELGDLVGLLQDQPAFAEYLGSPLVDPSARKDLLERTLRGRVSDTLLDTLQVLNRHGRLSILETVAETYRTLYQEHHDRVDVHVATAQPLSDAMRERIQATAARLAGRKPDLIEEVDPSLLGGLVLRIGDRKIDTSVAKDLRIVRDQLAERAAREIVSSRVSAQG